MKADQLPELEAENARLREENQLLQLELAKVQTAHAILKKMQVDKVEQAVKKREARERKESGDRFDPIGEATAEEALDRVGAHRDSPQEEL